MNDALDPRDDLTDRLASLGRQPVDSALRSEHLTQMAGVSAPGSTLRSAFASRAKLGAAVIAGFLIGTTGLATAGALGPLQNISSSAVRAVTPLSPPKHGNDTSDAAKNKPKDGDETSTENDGDGTKAAKYWEGCNQGDAKNRGQYLKHVRETGTPEQFKTAQHSDCGKAMAAHNAPKAGDTNDENATTPDPQEQPKAGDETHGDSANKGKSGAHKPDSAGTQPAETPNSDNASPAAPEHEVPAPAPAAPAGS